MTNIKRKWDRLSDEEKRVAKDELIHFFETERDEKIGVIAAEKILDHFSEFVGTKLYNRGIIDAKKAMENRFKELNYDLDDMLDL